MTYQRSLNILWLLMPDARKNKNENKYRYSTKRCDAFQTIFIVLIKRYMLTHSVLQNNIMLTAFRRLF